MKRVLKTMLTIFNIAVLCFALVIAVNSASYEDKTVVTVYDDNGSDTGEIFLGLSKTIFARVASGSSINRNVTWSSSNNDVAKVNNGVVTALKKGTAEIIATSGNASAVYKVTVVDENSTYEYNGTTYNYVWEKGTWGNNIKWYYCVGKRLIITGKGDMQEPPGHVSQIPWLSIDDSSSIEIQEGITSICAYAFGAMEACEIRIPSTITKIGRNAFYCFQSQSNWQKWYFGGTPKQWNDIEIGMYNDGLPSVPDMYCRATGHIYNSVATASTCTDKGYTTYTCECGDSYVADYVSALGHNYTSKITIPATHLKEGVKTFICVCGYTYTTPVEKLEEHTYQAIVKKPTCTSQGYTSYTCECGDSYADNYTDKLNHEYTSEVTTGPTHLTEGVKTFTCKCGDTYTEPVAKLEGHTYTSEVTKEATHLEEGETTYTCECGDSYTEVIAKLTGHTYEKAVTAPTCTAQGYTTYTCECGDSYVDNYTDKLEHVYASEITTPATHLTEGIETFTCECGDSYRKPVAKLKGHTYTSEVTKEPTHLEEGEMTFTCECGDSYTEVIEKIAKHNYKEDVTEPTCTAKGYTTYTCECGDIYVADYTDSKGHSYSAMTTQPTCTQNGLVTTFCTSCGDTHTETLEPTGHSFAEGSSKCENCDFDKADDCSCNCHKGGISGLIFKIILFFQRIFKTNKTCACGIAHY